MTDTSAHAQIYLYSETGLNPANNYVIENISSFLGTGTYIEYFQFLELKPKMTIKIQKAQNYLQFDANYDYDYCRIYNVGYGFDDTGAYYFIVGKHWKSKDCLELELEMDVLNSFEWDSDYEVSDKTLVKREHKNRFSTLTNFFYTSDNVSIPNGTTEFIIKTPIMASARIKSVGEISVITGTGLTFNVIVSTHSVKVRVTSSTAQTIKFQFQYEIYAYIANIDLKSEGITPPLYKSSEQNFNEPSGVSWSLLYKNSGTPNESPVDCFLYPSENLTVEVPSTANTLNKNNVPSDKYAIIFAPYNTPVPTFTFTDDNNTTRNFTPGYRTNMADEYIDVIAFKATANGVDVWTITASYSTYVGQWWGTWTKVASETNSVSVNGSFASLAYYPNTSLPTVAWISSHYNESVYATGSISMAALIQATLNNKDSIDRTDEKNIKLITLPYAPTPVVIDHNTSEITIGNEWYFNLSDGTLKLIDFNSKFKNRIESDQALLTSPLFYNTYQATWDGTASRGSIVDPKLLHSDFYYKKFVYDSFSKIFRLECIDWDTSFRKNKETHFTFDFITSRNIVSKFMFMFPQYLTGSKGIEDYDNILPVARNNEEVLFNSQYLNYLRTGYNYDLKTKERQEAAGAAGLGISIGSLLASIALTASGYGTAIGIAGIVGSVAGIASSTINYAKTLAQNEENIQRKLQESQNQAVSVLNADDFDLLEAYSGNIAKMCTYKTSVQMTDALSDIFHYAGYAVNEQYKPQIDTRYWFNFLQADLVITWTQNLSKEIIELIKKKFSEGVTFFHCHGSQWDLAQSKENIEKWIAIANGGAD